MKYNTVEKCLKCVYKIIRKKKSSFTSSDSKIMTRKDKTLKDTLLTKSIIKCKAYQLTNTFANEKDPDT